MNHNNWEHLVTRRLAVQVAIAWNKGFGSLFQKRYRTGIHNTLVYYNGKKTDYFVDKDELKKFNEDLDKLLENPEFVAGLIPEAKEFVEETCELIKLKVKDAKELVNSELSKLFSKFTQHHMNYYTRMWMVFRICDRIIIKIESMLKEVVKGDKKIKELSRIFSIPLKPNDVTNERIDLLKIALETEENREPLLQAHTKKYEHIPMFDFDHEPYKFEHFHKELKEIKQPKEELEKIKLTFNERQTEFEEILKKINPKPELNSLIDMLKKAVYLRDYRDMIRQKLNLGIRGFYKEIGSRIGLSLKEIALLTNEEIEKHLTESIQFDREEIEQRKKAFLLVQKGDIIEIFSGEKADRLARELSLTQVSEKRGEVKGRSASPGNRTGIAKIIYTNLDFGKINEGDILVSTMTRQDFVSVMRKVGAIVTNEGGVTSHAAIIARELGLPCIVGTKVATEVFNDGDIIQVDATNGIVTKVQ